MKNMSLNKVLILIIIASIWCSKADASIFNFEKQIDSIQLVYDQEALRLPGKKLEIGVYAYYKNGKVKKTWNLAQGTLVWSKFRVEVIGGSYSMGKITISDKLYPSKGKYIQVRVYPKKTPEMAKTLLLPLNYEEEVEIIPTTEMIKAPGFNFKFKVVSTFDNGVKKDYNFKRRDLLKSKYFAFSTEGGELKSGKFFIEENFQNINNHRANLTVVSKRNPNCQHSFDINLDYKANYYLTLSGFSGMWGWGGSNGASGSTGGHGGHGQNGQDGNNGSNGPDISVWTDLYYDSLLSTNLLYVYAENMWTGEEHRYLVNPDGGAFFITSQGGSGGNGGSGGSGGNGGNGADGTWHSKVIHDTDSTTITKTWQDAGGNGGDGGNGGNGGYGGDGGDGGDVFLYFTDDALPYEDIIHPDSNGGSGGMHGSGGSGGSGGKGGSGDPPGSNGRSGNSGSSGRWGSSGYGGTIFFDSTDDFVTY